jgi:MprA protease rhombosortase-interaction domain-containing protein
MKRLCCIAALLVALTQGVGAIIIATYDFTGETGNQTTTAFDSSYGVTAGGITRGAGLSSAALLNSMNSRQWTNSGSPDTGDYYQFTLAPLTGYTWDLTSLVFGEIGNSTGPTGVEVRTSLDSFATSTSLGSQTISPGVQGILAFDLSSLADISSGQTLTVRIYGYNASNSGNSEWALNNGTNGGLTVAGNLVPEPGSALLLVAAGAAGLCRRRSRRSAQS